MDVVSEQTLSKQTSSSPPPQRFFDVPYTKNDAVYGEMASPFLFSPNRRLLGTQYGIRKYGDNLKIGKSKITVENSSNISIRGKHFEGTADLWKLLTRKNVDYNPIDKNDLQKCKTILFMTNGHLKGYKAVGNIQTIRGIKFRNYIAKLFPEAKVASRQH